MLPKVTHLRGRQPYRLSQGEKRAAAIASVVALEPEVLVMDEPTSTLDPLARRRLIRLLKTFNHAKIIATHDLDFALEVCGRAISSAQRRNSRRWPHRRSPTQCGSRDSLDQF